ncbi:hypothetical protein FSST1_006806 [Fusarium sambucinum]
MFKFNFSQITGWRRMAAFLTISVFVLTCILVATLITSLYGIYDDAISIRNDTVIWEAKCDSTEKANLWLHLAINIISTGILASSNFFMQVLVAPTRKEVDKAHQKGYWVEIGVHSLRNFFFLPRHKNLLWLLFSITSVPLHLIFNGCILESRASNAFWVLVASEAFLEGAPWSVENTGNNQNSILATIAQIQNDVLEGHVNWDNISWSECMNRYNSPDIMMYEHRHVIMVDTSTTGWKISYTQNTTGSYDEETSSSLWELTTFIHVDSTAKSNLSEVPWLGPWEADSGIQPKYWKALDSWDGVITPQARINYCLSEKSEAACGLLISNRLLLIVCVMCSLKLILCVVTLFKVLRKEGEPLLTPGDAVASFITKPGEDTEDMCNLSSRDLTMYDTSWWAESDVGYSKLGRSKPWIVERVTSLAFAGFLFVQAIQEQPLQGSRFEHDPMHQPVKLGAITTTSLLGLTTIANIPQLLLSICYMALNGLVTRMMAEFEWSQYSTRFRSLRVTSPSGQQRSTYRLQLPYRWSIPILLISVLLHWVYSNCIYVSNYNYYDSNLPYDLVGTSRGLKHSTLAILIALVLSSIIAAVPLILSQIRLPGNITLGGSNSKVISAACHCTPRSSSSSAEMSLGLFEPTSLIGRICEDKENLLRDDDPVDAKNPIGQEILHGMSLQKLKWGDIAEALHDDGVGHLGFGTEDQEVTAPVEGRLYN